jgi:capsular polysaccharide transport system permease protein
MAYSASKAPPKALAARKFKTPRTVLALIFREMATSYGQSPGGYLWAVLQPTAAIAVMSIVFSAALRAPSLGTNFALFYATGVLPFTLYNDMGNKISKALIFSRQLLFYPGVRYIDAIIARFFLNLITHLMIFYVGISIIFALFDLTLILDIPAILLSLTMAAILGLGVGCLNCYLKSAFRIWEHFFAILTAPMFIISTILFTFESVPVTYRDYLWYNPLIHIIGLMRRGFYPTYDASYVSVTYVFAFSLITMAAGLMLLRRYHRDILNM